MRFLLIFILGFTSINFYYQSDFTENIFQGPHNLRICHDYDIGINYANKNSKLFLLDFNDYNCLNCRKMESLVWVDSEILKNLREKLIVISLIVNDNSKFPNANQRTISINGRKTNTQPDYIVLNHTG